MSISGRRGTLCVSRVLIFCANSMRHMHFLDNSLSVGNEAGGNSYIHKHNSLPGLSARHLVCVRACACVLETKRAS